MDVHVLAVENGGVGYRASDKGRTLECNFDWTVVGGVAQAITFPQEDDGIVRVAHQRRVCGDGVEHRLQVRWRTRHYPQDLPPSRLLLQRSRKLVSTRLQLREQAHVLDGDDRLVGEGLEESDLTLRKRSVFGAIHGEGADGAPVTEQRKAKGRIDAGISPGAVGKLPRPLGRAVIQYMDHRALNDGAPADAGATDRARLADAE